MRGPKAQKINAIVKRGKIDRNRRDSSDAWTGPDRPGLYGCMVPSVRPSGEREKPEVAFPVSSAAVRVKY